MLKEPLVHFLGLGLVLFLAYGWLNPADDQPGRIVVDREALLTHLQYQTRVFQPELAEARLDAMSSEELSQLIKGYIREEALYRHALSLNLGKDDYIIKRRLIQKVEFIAEGAGSEVVELQDAEVRQYYAEHKARYREPADIVFTQVFFRTGQRQPEEARLLAEQKLAELRSSGAVFTDAPKHGERFPFGVNFVERTHEHIASQFGEAMADQLFAIDPVEQSWAGPFQSEHGFHLVMVVKRRPERDPDYEKIRQRVASDLASARQRRTADSAVQAIVEGYQVDVRIDAG